MLCSIRRSVEEDVNAMQRMTFDDSKESDKGKTFFASVSRSLLNYCLRVVASERGHASVLKEALSEHENLGFQSEADARVLGDCRDA